MILELSQNESFEKVEIIESFKDNPNTIITKTANKDGWLFISEKMSMYDGWNAQSNTKSKEILKANNVLSAIEIQANENNVRFDFKPKSYIFGRYVQLLTILILLFYFSKIKIKKIRE